jgi:bifunctional ADP-heptose synthase (sugar kinase/adenylyltransferase)
MLLINDKFIKKYSAFTKKVYDVTGAGDTVIAALSVMISIGLDIKTSVLISNFIASIVIGKKGTAVMNYSDLKNN